MVVVGYVHTGEIDTSGVPRIWCWRRTVVCGIITRPSAKVAEVVVYVATGGRHSYVSAQTRRKPVFHILLSGGLHLGSLFDQGRFSVQERALVITRVLRWFDICKILLDIRFGKLSAIDLRDDRVTI